MVPPNAVARVCIGLPLVIVAVAASGGAAQAQPVPSATNIPGQRSSTNVSGQPTSTNVPAQPSEPSPPSRATANGGSRHIDWELGVRSVLTLSDNLTFAPAGSKRDGARLEVSPFVTGSTSRPRQQALLSYRMRNFYHSVGGGEYDGPRHELNSFGNLAVHDDWLWLGAQAQVFDQAADPFRLNTADPSSQRDNRSRLVRYQIGPYVRNRLDAATDYQAGYVFGHTDYGANRVGITHHGVNGRITRDPALRSLGWHVGARALRDEYDSGAEVDRDNFRVVGLLRATRQLRVGAGIEYSRISVVANRSGSTGGWGPTAQLNWAPSPATSVDLQATHAYYGNAGSARLSRRTGRWTFALRYDQGIVIGSEASLSYSPLAAPYEIGERGPGHDQTVDDSVERGTLPLAGMPLASGLVGGALVDSRRLGVTAIRADPLNAISLSVFSSRSRSVRTTVALPSVAYAPDEIDRTGAILQYSRRLSPRTSAEFYGARTWSQTPDDSMSTNLTLLTVALRYRLTRKAITGLAYRHSRQRSTAGLHEYDENAILASIDVRF